MTEKLAGDDLVRKFVNDIPVWEPESVPFTKPKPLSKARVAIVTTAGFRTDGDAYWMPGDQGYCEIPDGTKNLTLAHFSPNFDRSGVMADLNVVFPTDRLHEMAAAGTIGSVAPRHFSFMGGQADHKLATMRMDSGPAAANKLKEDGVDVVLLSPI